MNFPLWQRFGITVAICFLLTPAATVLGNPVVGQISDFEDGTTGGWIVNLLGLGTHPAPPQNALGGPGGPDDNYLRLTAVGGGGPGSRLTALNLSPQWTGDYLAAGVSAITMDLNNFGSTDLYLRLLFEDPTTGPPENIAFSTDAIYLPGGSGWTSVTFLISPGHLTAGLGGVNAALTNTTAIRLFHSPTATFPGPVVAGVLGVDNIQAVPEPATMLLLGTGLVGVGAAMRRRLKK